MAIIVERLDLRIGRFDRAPRATEQVEFPRRIEAEPVGARLADTGGQSSARDERIASAFPPAVTVGPRRLAIWSRSARACSNRWRAIARSC